MMAVACERLQRTTFCKTCASSTVPFSAGQFACSTRSSSSLTSSCLWISAISALLYKRDREERIHCAVKAAKTSVRMLSRDSCERRLLNASARAAEAVHVELSEVSARQAQ